MESINLKLGGNTSLELGSSTKIGGNTAKRGGNTAKMGGNTAKMGGNTAKMGGNTAKMGGNTAKMGGNTAKMGGNKMLKGGSGYAQMGEFATAVYGAAGGQTSMPGGNVISSQHVGGLEPKLGGGKKRNKKTNKKFNTYKNGGGNKKYKMNRNYTPNYVSKSPMGIMMSSVKKIFGRNKSMKNKTSR
jgi:hypothetical protein